MSVIVVQNLTKKYGDQVAVDNISFQINKKEIVGFIGPNGAGKSTTMRMLCSYMQPSSGAITIDGVPLDIGTIDIKRKIGYLPENNPLYLDMTIVDFLDFCARIQGVDKTAVGDRVKKMIRICGLNPEKHKKIGELSKGYRQRVGLAQAIIHDPEILILDEPTTGLDPNQIIEIRSLIKELGREKTIILSSHILSEIEAICDKVIIINQGKIVADDSFETLKKDSNTHQVLLLEIESKDPKKVEKQLSAIKGVEKILPVAGKPGSFKLVCTLDNALKKEIFSLCVKNQWFLLEMSAIETTLEDVFREITH